MSRQAGPKRTITKFDGRSTCSYTRARPYKGCVAPAKYVMTVETQGGAKRQPMTMRYRYCEEHVPWEKVRPASDSQPDLPANPIGAQAAADLIGVSLMTLHHWRGRGKGPKSTKARGRCWYSRDQVERYAEAYRIVNGGEDR